MADRVAILQIGRQSLVSQSVGECLRSVCEGGRFYTHDMLALLSVTFGAARDADDYAVRMAKAWIEDRDS